jgi:glycosyltransferase involved in cell wall biosynthesis
MNTDAQFIVATPERSVCDDNARALEHAGCLRFIALGTRKGIAGVPPERTRLNPAIGLAAYICGRAFSAYWGEYLRFHLHPWFDRWVRSRLVPGDHLISSYGYTNASFKWVRAHGGKTFLDGGNSHPENFWAILSEEHRRWKCPYPPVGRHHYRRAVAMMEDVDFVLSPSSFVTESFLTRGFSAEQIIRNVYPLDLGCFTPPPMSRPADRPLTIISTGTVTLRKGTPYLLEAFRLIQRVEPHARLCLTSLIADNMKPVLAQYADLPIDWSPPLRHPQLAERLRGADIFVLPSLEDGFARTVAEALACGLPVITTPNTGASDLIRAGENGEIVPIRDPQAIADAVLRWWERRRAADAPPISFDPTSLSVAHFEAEFLSQLRAHDLIP